jgi:hypothetical protein
MDETCYTTMPKAIEVINDGISVFDLSESEWLQEIRTARDRFFVKGSVMHEMYGEFAFSHYAVWFDHVGMYELVARSLEISTD